MAHPGVANDFGDEDAKKYYSYYQWVCFVLFFQGIMCYTPKWIWDNSEGGLMKTLVMGLRIGICGEEEKCKKKKAIIDYLLKHIKVRKLSIVILLGKAKNLYKYQETVQYLPTFTFKTLVEI